MQSVQKYICRFKFYGFKFLEIVRGFLILNFTLKQKIFFKMSQKQKLRSSQFFWYCKNKTNEMVSKIKFNKVKFLYMLSFFCFKNSLTISKKKINLLANCFACKQRQLGAVNQNFVKFTVLNTCFNSFFFSFLHFNRVIFNFLCHFKTFKTTFSFKNYEAICHAFCLALVSLKKKKVASKFVLNKNSVPKQASNSLQVSGHLKKNVFLKSFFFWKIKKLKFKSKLKLYKLFNKYKQRTFGFLKYSQLLKFFPHLRSFFYKKFRRSKFSRHPTSALTICVFFLPKRLFFRRKRYLKSPPFLFKRYSKYLKIKKEMHITFPKIFPIFYEKKAANVLLFKTKNLYKKKLLDYFKNLKKKHTYNFAKKNLKMQKINLIKSLQILKIWKLFFSLKKRFPNICFFKLFLLKFKHGFLQYFNFMFKKTKTFLTLSLKKTYKKLTLLPIFHLIYYELYYLIKAGIFFIPCLHNFIFARFLCFLKIFSNYKLQIFLLNSILRMAKIVGPKQESNIFFEGFNKKFFLLSFFKRVKKPKLFFARRLPNVQKFIQHLQNFLFNLTVIFKNLKLNIRFFSSFFKNIFLRFFKILMFRLKKISGNRRYVGISPSFSLHSVDMKKKKETSLLYFNKKFKQSRNIYFLNFSKNVTVSKTKISKKYLNFLKLFVPSAQI